jgi:hypothetical protein
MRDEPLFIKFLNSQIDATQVIEAAIAQSKNKRTTDIATAKKKEFVDLSIFKEDFLKVIVDLIDNGVNQRVTNYLDSYMKPSLEEFIEPSQGSRVNESRYVGIKAEDAPWVEAILCYNLCIYIKAWGLKDIKQCPTCGKIFTTRGQYAKYCSEACKRS